MDLIASAVNGGYPYGNNVGLRHVGFTTGVSQPPRFALLLNPDTVVPPTALHDMLAFCEARPDCGVAGPKLLRPDGSLDLACRRSFPARGVVLSPDWPEPAFSAQPTFWPLQPDLFKPRCPDRA